MFKLIVLFFVLINLNQIESRLGLRYRLKKECRDQFPRTQSDLPEVVLTGFVEQIYPSLDGGDIYSGSVIVKRILRGSKKLENNKITIEGFGDKNLCHSKVQKRDSWIFLLLPVSDGFMRLNGSLQKPNLYNIDRMNALTQDQIYRRRPDIIKLACEQHYCPNNAICVEEKSNIGILSRARCQCLTTCPTNYEPVCGSNGETFSNECKLRMESCKRDINLFVRYPSPCESGRRTREVASEYLPNFN